MEIHEALRDRLRLAGGRAASPSGAIIDSQSVKTTEKGGLVAMMRKKVCGRAPRPVDSGGASGFRIETGLSWR